MLASRERLYDYAASSTIRKQARRFGNRFTRHNPPVDNNIVERALKKAILNRKNALFYKTLNGSGVGDLFMSLIHTCELNGANPFDYLTELQRHSEELKQKPSEWMPWNYRDALARLTTPAAA
jgi:transposase